MISSVKSLTECRSGKDLAITIAHAILGWLNMYQQGFLHRDISLGSILAFKEPEEREPFRLTDDFKASLGDVTMQMLNDKLERLGFQRTELMLIPDAASWATKLEQLLEAHNIGTSCMAFIIDGDLAKDWKYMFEHWSEEKELSRRERSGTDSFMSHNLLSDNEIKEYIQSPADDVESFLWVILYAMINNTEFRSLLHQDLAERFESGDRNGALIGFLATEHGYGLFNDLQRVQARLSGGYRDVVEYFSAIGMEKGWKSDEEEAQYWMAAWHGFALEGVCRALKHIFEYIDRNRK